MNAQATAEQTLIGGGDRLSPGEQLLIGQTLVSANQEYTLAMQTDGNMVLYEYGGTPVWDTGTWGRGEHRPTCAVMQTDGNLVLYSALGAPQWASGSNGDGNRTLVLQDDRNLVIYADGGQAVWDAHSSFVPKPQIDFDQSERVGSHKRMRTRGTLANNGILTASVFTTNQNWSTGLRGRVLAVVYDPHGNAIWVSNDFIAATRCSVPDPSCASAGQQTWVESFPLPVAKYADRIELYQEDSPSPRDLRQTLITTIKTAGEVAKEIKDILEQLQ